MARINFDRTTLEKLDPPTSVAGQVAEAAYVTRIYIAEHDDPGSASLVSVSRIETLWGRSLADVSAALDAERASKQKHYAEEIARIDAAKEAIAAKEELKP